MATALPPISDATAEMAGDARFMGLAQKLRSLQADAKAGSATAQSSEELHQAAQGFESMFLNLLLKEMMPEKGDNGDSEDEEDQIFGGGLFGNGLGSETYQQLFISGLSDTLAGSGKLGLADMIEKEVAQQAGLTDESKNGTEPKRLQPLSIRRSSFNTAAIYGGHARAAEKVEAQYHGSYHRLLEPVQGRESSSFGVRTDPFTAQLREHRGVDIAAAEGTQIHAAASGRVSYSGWMKGYGNVVIIEHGDGLETRYAHNADNKVKKGDTVTAGQVVALVGETGRATGPHLHFEVRRDGIPEDPETLLRSAD